MVNLYKYLYRKVYMKKVLCVLLQSVINSKHFSWIFKNISPVVSSLLTPNVLS
jgi:hypothetical protein